MKTVILTMKVVLPLLANPSFYQTIKGFEAVRQEARQFKTKATARITARKKAGKCGGCTGKKLMMEEYLRLYTEFVRAYTRLWYQDRDSLVRLKDFLDADRVELPTKKGHNTMPVE